MMDFSEKRDFQRMVLDCSMEYQLENGNEAKQARVINLSAKGVLFETSEALNTGDRVHIKLTPVNNITPPMSADTLVTRCDEVAEENYQVAAEIVQIR